MPNVRLNLLRENYLTDLRERSLIHLYLSFLDSFFTGNYWTSFSDAESPWTRSLDGLPLFTLREIEAFFKDSGKTAKLNKRTEQLLNDNFHDNINCLNEGSFFYVRAICGASYRKENHKLCFAIKKSSSAVKYAYCTCRAGKGGWCNHVYALMKVIAKFSLEESKCIPELLPCTSKPCGWTVPRKRQQNVSKSSVMDTTVKKQSQNSRELRAICLMPEQNI